jgi:flavodoxin
MPKKKEDAMKQLVVYFSKTGGTYMAGRIVDVTQGNTDKVAKMIAEDTGADLFQLEPEQPYPDDYNACTEIAAQEQKRNARPALKALPNIDDYDVIWLGYPCWWGTYPQVVQTLLDGVDFSGKTIFPFCTNEGSGMGSSMSDLKRSCPNATIGEGLPLTGNRVDQSGDQVKAWTESQLASVVS